MALIYKTKNFIVEAVGKPHISRTDGGHIKIYPKKRILDRQELTPNQAIEFMRLTMIVGEAMKIALNKRGIDIGRINYQDMGNWTPYFHMHLYGRAKSVKIQKYGDSMNLPQRATGFYDSFEPLDEGDIKEIQKQIKIISKNKKYSSSDWHLK